MNVLLQARLPGVSLTDDWVAKNHDGQVSFARLLAKPVDMGELRKTMEEHIRH